MIYTDGPTRIRPFTPADMTERYRGWMHDPDVTKHNSHGLFPYTDEKMAAWKRAIEGAEPWPSMIVWAIESEVTELFASESGLPVRREGRRLWLHIGNVSLQSINWIYRSAEMAIVIGEREAWGKGHGLRAWQMVERHAFDKLNLRRLWCGTSDQNRGMQSIAERAGWEKEGLFRDGMFYGGQYRNIVCYAKVRE